MKNRITGRSAFLALLEGRGRHASVRQSRHHRIADHARAEGSSRPHLCDGDAGKPRRRHGRRLQPRLGQTRRLQCPRRARPRQRDGLALQRKFYRHAVDPDRRPAGAGPRPDGAGAVWSAGPDGRAPGEMGGRGDAAGGSAADRAPRRQDRDHAADRAGVHLAARRYPQCRGRHRARPLHPRRYPRQAVGRIAAGAGRADPESGAAGDHHRRRDRQERRAARKRLNWRRRSAARPTSRPRPMARISCPKARASWARWRAFRNWRARRFRLTISSSRSAAIRCECRFTARSIRCRTGFRSCRSAWSIGISPGITAPRSR